MRTGYEDLNGHGFEDPFSWAELTKALKEMKKGRASDENGIVIEMLQDGSEMLLKLVLDMFNEILSMQSGPPGQWRETLIKVIHKKGDRQLIGNYRPISIIPSRITLV